MRTPPPLIQPHVPRDNMRVYRIGEDLYLGDKQRNRILNLHLPGDRFTGDGYNPINDAPHLLMYPSQPGIVRQRLVHGSSVVVKRENSVVQGKGVVEYQTVNEAQTVNGSGTISFDQFKWAVDDFRGQLAIYDERADKIENDCTRSVERITTKWDIAKGALRMVPFESRLAQMLAEGSDGLPKDAYVIFSKNGMLYALTNTGDLLHNKAVQQNRPADGKLRKSFYHLIQVNNLDEGY